MLAAVALGDAHDQLLADVAREIEVDVGRRDHLVVDEAAERQTGCDGIDVREARQVADDRADARAAAAARRQHVAGAAGAAYLERALAGQLEHLPVEQEEPRQPEPGDQPQLVLQPLVRTPLVAVRVRVALGERVLADAGELDVGRIGTVGEVRVAVAELLRSGRTCTARRPRGCAAPPRAAAARASPPATTSTCSWFPRRSRSQPSRDVRCLIATSASCSRARR